MAIVNINSSVAAFGIHDPYMYCLPREPSVSKSHVAGEINFIIIELTSVVVSAGPPN